MTCLIVVPALAWTAMTDLLYRRISNRIVGALLLLWLARAIWLLAHGAAGPVFGGVPAAGIVLVSGYLLFSMGWMGAGDAKLMAVLCLWLGGQSFTFLIVTALAGGLLALGMPLLRQLERTLALGLMQLHAWLPRLGIPLPQALGNAPVPGIPYGLAIATGAIFTLCSSSS